MKRFEYPARLELARLPTPIEHLQRYSQGLPGVEVWIKRDDQTGFLQSGNKVRKLEFILAQCLADGVDGVITCGGVNSNHCRATAAVAARLGLEAHLLLRTPDGKAPERLMGNAFLDRILGAHLRWITPAEYKARDALMQDYVLRAAGRGRRMRAIAEGASDALGALGYVRAVEETMAQLEAMRLRIDFVVHAVGSGGTSAGWVAGSRHFEAPWTTLAFAVCDDREYFRAKIDELLAGLAEFGVVCGQARGHAPFEIVDHYKGAGYGLTDVKQLERIRSLAALEGILLDPCYTGKAFIGMHEEILAGRIPPRSKVLFLHTGGGFGNFAYQQEWDRSFAADSTC